MGVIFRFFYMIPYYLEEITVFIIDHTLFGSKRIEEWCYRKSFERLNRVADQEEREVQ